MILNINEELKKKSVVLAGKIALTAILEDTEDTHYSYAELERKIGQICGIFRNQDINKNDCILTLLPNSVELAMVYLSACRYGLKFAPLSCESPSTEIEKIYSIIKPQFCVVSDLIYDTVKDTLNTLEIPHLVISCDTQFEWLDDTTLNIDENLNSKLLIMTSGTTGEPKIMQIDNDKLFSSATAFLKYHNLSDSKLRFWNYLPMSYLGGLFNLLIIPLASGGSSVIGENFNGRTFLSFWQTVERFDIDALWFTPSILRGLEKFAVRMSEAMRHNYTKKIKISFLGTAPIDLEDKIEFEKLFDLDLLENFALSETTFLTSEKTNDKTKRQNNSVGESLPYINLKLKTVEEQKSEIYIKTPYLFDGYINKSAKLVLDLDEEGFFATKDLAHFDGDVLVLDGRIKDIIKKGGYFINLKEIENISKNNNYIVDACTVTIKHDFYGESYNLYIIKTPEADKESIRSWILSNVVKYKWPENIVFKDSFQKTMSGKVKKESLLES